VLLVEGYTMLVTNLSVLITPTFVDVAKITDLDHRGAVQLLLEIYVLLLKQDFSLFIKYKKNNNVTVLLTFDLSYVIEAHVPKSCTAPR
jgi:hypothetical protein